MTRQVGWTHPIVDSSVVHDKDYELVAPLQTNGKRGIQCGLCGIKFDYDKAYDYWCGNLNCPVTLQVRC